MILKAQLVLVWTLLALPSLPIPKKIYLFSLIVAFLCLVPSIPRLKGSHRTLFFCFTAIAGTILVGSAFVEPFGQWTYKSSFDFILTQMGLGAGVVAMLARARPEIVGRLVRALAVIVAIFFFAELVGINWHKVFPSYKTDSGTGIDQEMVEYYGERGAIRYRAYFNESSSFTGTMAILAVSLFVFNQRFRKGNWLGSKGIDLALIIFCVVVCFSVKSKAGLIVLVLAAFGFALDGMRRRMSRGVSLVGLGAFAALALSVTVPIVDRTLKGQDGYLAREWYTFRDFSADEFSGTSSRVEYWRRAFNVALQYPFGGGAVGIARHVQLDNSTYKNREMVGTDLVDPVGLKNVFANILGFGGFISIAILLVGLYLSSRYVSGHPMRCSSLLFFASLGFLCVVEGYFCLSAVAIMYSCAYRGDGELVVGERD